MPQAHQIPPEVTRAARAAGKGIFPLGGPLEGSRWIEDGRLRLSPPEGAPRGVYLHLHGGGWTFGSPEHYDAANQALARATGLAVLSARYLLAPEHPWPAGADDACEALDFILTHPEFGAGPVFIGGESAGAHYAAVALARLAARGEAGRIAGAVLWYGLYDLRLTPSMANWGPESLILSTPTVEWFADNLTGGNRAARADPALSPLLGDLAAFPPALLICGTADPLIDDTLFLAARLAAAGRAVSARLYPGGVHAFDQFDLAIARAARAEAHAWILERMAA
ncbi:MAG: alpha/beta hydrolase fold domain-containing protein [Rubrimonas sp.]